MAALSRRRSWDTQLCMSLTLRQSAQSMQMRTRCLALNHWRRQLSFTARSLACLLALGSRKYIYGVYSTAWHRAHWFGLNSSLLNKTGVFGHFFHRERWASAGVRSWKYESVDQSCTECFFPQYKPLKHNKRKKEKNWVNTYIMHYPHVLICCITTLWVQSDP